MKLDDEALRQALEVAVNSLDLEDRAGREIAVREGLAPGGIDYVGTVEEPGDDGPLIVLNDAQSEPGHGPWLAFNYGGHRVAYVHGRSVAVE